MKIGVCASPDKLPLLAELGYDYLEANFSWLASLDGEALRQNTALIEKTGVPAEAWYAPALAWAAEKGLVSGEGFAPAAPCTRAEIVSLLYRAAN